MLEFLVSTLAFIVAISVLVAVHEYGHFWVARKLGFKVLRFSVGFGRPLLRWRSKDADQVEYWISSIPLGGYVKMLDEREGEVAPEEAHRAFNRRPVWQRVAVLAAGPGANFVFAIVAVWLMLMVGIAGQRMYVADVRPDSVAASAGLRADDVVIAVGGQSTPTIDQALIAMFDELLGDGRIELGVEEADGDRRELVLDVRGRVGELTEPDALFDGLGIELVPRTPAVVDTVVDGQPAAAAGIRAGDRIVAIDGEAVSYWSEVVERISARPGEQVELGIERNGALLTLPVEAASVVVDGATVGRIGIGGRELPGQDALRERLLAERRYGPIDAMSASLGETWALTELTVRMLGRMLTGEVSIKNASGPLMIAAYAGEYVRAGLDYYLKFLAMISISLGIMNLLPVPILDGGQIVMSVVEGVKGRPLSLRTAVIGQQIGLAMLIALFGVVFYNDITRLLGL